MKTRVRIQDRTVTEFNEHDQIFNEIATRQRSIDFHAALYFLPNPDPVLKRRGQDITVYNELLTDPSVAANVASWKDGVQELEWDIDRGKSKTANAETIKRIFLDMDTRDESGGLFRIIDEVLNARLFGYQPCEVMWERVGNMIVPVDIIAKPQEWFAFNSNNELLLRTDASLAGDVVPDYKFICPTHGSTYKNPYGRGVLSSCFWPVTFKKGGLKFFMQFCEKYGMPWVVGEHTFTKDEDVEGFLDDLDTMVADGVIAIGKDKQKVSVIPTGTNASADIYNNLVAIMREEIAHAILNHSRATSSTPGKLGNESGALEARSSVINAGKKLVQQAMNVVIKWTYELNRMSGDVPRFIFFEEEEVDMATAERDEKLGASGVRFTKSYYMRTYGLDDADFDLAEPAPAQPPRAFAEEEVSEDQRLIDEIGDTLSALTSKKVGDAMVTPLLDYVQGASSYEDALDNLVTMFDDVDVSELQDLLTKVHAAGTLVGRTHAHH